MFARGRGSTPIAPSPRDALVTRPGDPARRSGPFTACRWGSRTSSTPRTCRPRTARRSTPATGRRRVRRAPARRRGGGPRQDHHDRARALRSGADPQPGRPRSHSGGLVERLGRRRRRRDGPARAGHADRRVDHSPGCVLRRARAEADPVGLESTGDPLFCRAWTLLGLPTVSVPGLVGPAGMPLGVQLIGRAGEEAALLRAAA